MTLIVDAGPLVAAGDARDPRAGAVARLLIEEAGPVVIPAQVTAEVDYLLASRGGQRARQSFLEDLADRRFEVACLTAGEYRAVAMLEEAYADLAPGLADLSCVVIAHRFRTNRILTFDERHFRALRTIEGGTFRILPRDV